MREFTRRARRGNGPRFVVLPPLNALTLDPIEATVGVPFVSTIGGATPGSTITAEFGLFQNVVVDRETLTITAMPTAQGQHAGVLTETLEGSPNSPNVTRIAPMPVAPPPPLGARWRQEFTFNNAILTPGAPFENFHVVLTSANFSEDIFTPAWGAQTDGADIWVSSDPEGRVRLPVDLAFWHKPTQRIVLWTTLPQVAPGVTTRFYVWWNNPGQAIVPPLAPNAPFGRNAVWAEEWAVHHFNEASGPFIDSTGGGADIPLGTSTFTVDGPLGRRAVIAAAAGHGEAAFNARLQPGSRPVRTSVFIIAPAPATALRFSYGIPSNATPTQSVVGIGVSDPDGRTRPVIRLDNNGSEVRSIAAAGGPRIDPIVPMWVTVAYAQAGITPRLRGFAADVPTPTSSNAATNHPVWPSTRGLCLTNPSVGFAHSLDMAIMGPDRGDGRWYATEHIMLSSPGDAVIRGPLVAYQEPISAGE